MNRVIKFRAWGRYGDLDEETDKRKFEMIDGDSLCFEKFKPICEILQDKDDCEYFMQFTGLHDENGKEIYEGDIVNTVYGNFEVEWNDDCCKWQYSNGMDINDGEMYGMSKFVIGNMYENPELLTPHQEPPSSKPD